MASGQPAPTLQFSEDPVANSGQQLVPTLQFSEAAAARVNALNVKSAALKLRVYIIGGGCMGFQYDFLLDESVQEGDLIISNQGAELVVDPMTLLYLAGATVDYVEGLGGSRFVVNNLAVKTTCSCGTSFTL